MNKSLVNKIVAVVPERTARLHTGTPFAASGALPGSDTRLAYLSRLLHWLTPLDAVSKDDQRELGVAAGHGRLPRGDEDEDGEPGEGERGMHPGNPAADRFS